MSLITLRRFSRLSRRRGGSKSHGLHVNYMGGHPARLLVDLKDFFHTRRFAVWHPLQRFRYDSPDGREIDSALQESFDRNLVRSIQDAGCRPAVSLRVIGQIEEGELRPIGRIELPLPGFFPIDLGNGSLRALGPG